MTRSPLFYPMHRGDTDAGGAADLQTDIMRFMAILALCLVAIFALVQSIPLVPEPQTQSQAEAAPPPPASVPQRLTRPIPDPGVETVEKADAQVTLTRPQPVAVTEARPEPQQALPEEAVTTTIATAAPQQQGFTLRFESDLVLTRLVAAGQIGFYAIGTGRSQRMTVSESRISFWDASAPNTFHEMETTTVPAPVIDALARTGAETSTIDWGVTLPGRLRRQLDAFMQEHSGGSLVIGADGNLRLEST